MGYLIEPEDFQLGGREEEEVVFKVEGTCHSKRRKQPRLKNTHSVTVIPRLSYLSALTSEMARCFIQALLE